MSIGKDDGENLLIFYEQGEEVLSCIIPKEIIRDYEIDFPEEDENER